jgi:hypothetical protein
MNDKWTHPNGDLAVEVAIDQGEIEYQLYVPGVDEELRLNLSPSEMNWLVHKYCSERGIRIG